MNNRSLKPAFGWIGGKSKLVADIKKIIPTHKHYIEVFGGSLALLYAKDKSDVEIVNDINDHLVNLHRVIKSNHNSFEKLIKEYDMPTSFFYCDPPYVGTEDYYKNAGGFSKREHELLADRLSKIKGKFLVSYNDCDTVRRLYKGFNFIKTKEIGYSLSSSGSHKIVREVFIMNYKPVDKEKGLFDL